MSFKSWFSTTFIRKVPRKRQPRYVDDRYDHTELENQFMALKHEALRYGMADMAAEIDAVLNEMSNLRDRIGHKVVRTWVKGEEWRRRAGGKTLDPNKPAESGTRDADDGREILNEGKYVEDEYGDLQFGGKWGDLYTRLKDRVEQQKQLYYDSDVYSQVGRQYADSVNRTQRAGAGPGEPDYLNTVGPRNMPGQARAAQRARRTNMPLGQFGPRSGKRQGGPRPGQP